jgi:hypothetical protein
MRRAFGRRALRRGASGENAKSPRWIETVAHRGHRFAAPPVQAQDATTAQDAPPAASPAASPAAPPAALIGRTEALQQRWQEAAAGHRRRGLLRRDVDAAGAHRDLLQRPRLRGGGRRRR